MRRVRQKSNICSPVLVQTLPWSQNELQLRVTKPIYALSMRRDEPKSEKDEAATLSEIHPYLTYVGSHGLEAPGGGWLHRAEASRALGLSGELATAGCLARPRRRGRYLVPPPGCRLTARPRQSNTCTERPRGGH